MRLGPGEEALEPRVVLAGHRLGGAEEVGLVGHAEEEVGLGAVLDAPGEVGGDEGMDAGAGGAAVLDGGDEAFEEFGAEPGVEGGAEAVEGAEVVVEAADADAAGVDDAGHGVALGAGPVVEVEGGVEEPFDGLASARLLGRHDRTPGLACRRATTV